MRRNPAGPSGREVFEILAREHADMLTAYLRGLLSDSSALDDVFQETMIVAWRRLTDYDRERPFGPWLRGIARNLVRAHFREAAAAPLVSSDAALDAIDRRFDQLARVRGETFRDRVDTLLDCVAKLPDRLREIIDLVYARNLLVRAAAELLGEHEEATKKRLQRARKSLLDCLLARSAAS